MNSAAAFDPYLDDLAHLICSHGIEHFEGDVARLAVRLHAAGQSPSLIALLIDQQASSISRERAFGNLVAALATASSPLSEQGPPLDRLNQCFGVAA
jgi:hypothetical protein